MWPSATIVWQGVVAKLDKLPWSLSRMAFNLESCYLDYPASWKLILHQSQTFVFICKQQRLDDDNHRAVIFKGRFAYLKPTSGNTKYTKTNIKPWLTLDPQCHVKQLKDGSFMNPINTTPEQKSCWHTYSIANASLYWKDCIANRTQLYTDIMSHSYPLHLPIPCLEYHCKNGRTASSDMYEGDYVTEIQTILRQLHSNRRCKIKFHRRRRNARRDLPEPLIAIVIEYYDDLRSYVY